MSFQPHLTLSNDPAVQMFFHGLVVLHSPDGQVWRAEPHREAANHVLSIEVRMKDPPGPDVILMRRHGNLPMAGGDFTVTMRDDSGAAVTPAAKRFISTGSSDEDSGAILNLRELHKDSVVAGNPPPRPLVVKAQKTRPGILVNGGESVIYTARVERRPFKLKNNMGGEKSFDRFASIVGARIFYGGSGASAWITGAGLTDPVKLEKPAAGSRVSYEIYLNNNPLVEPISAAHSEMAEYYEIVERDNGDDIPPNEQFELVFDEAMPDPVLGLNKVTMGADRRASIRIPCLPTTVD